MSDTPAGISDSAVTEATGHGWDHWLAALDDRGATDLDHRDIVDALAEAGVESPWWRQTIANGYEVERGIREVGETLGAGFQVGVQRTLDVGQEDLWDLLVSPAGRSAWLGTVDAFDPGPGFDFETAEGTVGEVRTVSTGERLRLTWQPEGRPEPTTLQLTLSCLRNDDARTTLRVHHEKLADADEREAMREHWRAVLDRLAELVGGE